MTKVSDSYTELGEPVGTHTWVRESFESNHDVYKVRIVCEFDNYRAELSVWCEWDGNNYSGYCGHCGTLYELPSDS